MHEVSERLTQTLANTYSNERISQTLAAVYHRFEGKPIRDFVPILVERLTREELAAEPEDTPPISA